MAKTIAFLTASEGIEQVELTEPWQAVLKAGGTPQLLSTVDAGETVQAFNHLDKADTFTVDTSVSQANVADYDGLVLPGGVMNADKLRVDPDAVRFTRAILDSGTPVGVICHGAWILIETGLIRGRILTSYPTLRTDLQNAGARWVDEEVRSDNGLVSSRRPADLPAFNSKIIEEFAEGLHLRKTV